MSAMSAGCSLARRSCEILSFTRRAGSVSMRSTKSQGMVRGGICRNRARKATSGTTPFSNRRIAPRGPDVHRTDFQDQAVGDGFLKKVQIVDPDDFSPEHIDDLLIEQVTSQQEHAFRAVALGPVVVGELARIPPLIEVTDSERQKAVASAGLNDQHRNPGPVFLRDQRHLAHPAASASGGVEHRRAQQFGKREGRHASENTQLTGKNPQELL